MNLEERYNAASENTYVGKVRARQAADAGDISGVNFLDGDGRGQFAPGQSAPPDVVQNEFKRNVAGDFRYSGGGKVPGGSTDGNYPLSRWLQRGVEKGDTYMTNNRYTTISDARNASNLVYKYSPLIGKSFSESDILSEMSKSKIGPQSSPVGPTPAGLNG